MEPAKPWYMSYTVWFALAQAILGVLIGAGALPDMGSSTLPVAGGGVAGLSVGTIWGRFRARKQITLGERASASYHDHGQS